MYKLIKNGRMIANLPVINGRVATAGESISDGDTIAGSIEGLLSVRLCGIDSPEMGIEVDKNDVFKKKEYLSTEKFADYLEDPFKSIYKNSDEFVKALGTDFVDNSLKPRLNKDAANNHKFFAEQAREELRKLVESDIRLCITLGHDYKIQIDFPFEVFDRFSRFLGWIQRFEPKDEFSKDIKPYNELLLEKGFAFPYFIWPNISISNRNYNLEQLVPIPAKFEEWITKDKKFQNMYHAARRAREKKLGVYSSDRPLIMPFELRFMLERNYGISDDSSIFEALEGVNERMYKKPLFRYVINLADAANPSLLKPNKYYTIPNPEDRLFIPPEYVPLFKEKGYKENNTKI